MREEVQLDQRIVLLCCALSMLFRFREGGARRRVMQTAHFDFRAVGENIYGIKTGMNQALTGREEE